MTSTDDPTKTHSSVASEAPHVAKGSGGPEDSDQVHKDTSSIPARTVIACISCRATFVKKRSPMKGYKITQFGALCDVCFPQYVRTTVMEFGCAAERYGGFQNTEAAIGVLKKANVFWNKLVEVNRWERDEYRRLTTDAEIEAECGKHTATIEAIDTEVQNQKKIQMTRKPVLDPALAESKKTARAARKVLYAALKTARTAMKEMNASAIKDLKVEVERRITAASEESNLNWTMVEPILARFKTASSRSKKDGTVLKFRRFDGTGILTVPYTNGISLTRLTRSDATGKFQVGGGLMSEHPRERRTLCRLQIAYSAGGARSEDVWLSLPVIFHRPIPQDADIRHIAVKREVLAGVPRWKVCFTVRAAVESTAASGAVGIDLGWRKRADGSLRVAYWSDDAGNNGELIYPAWHIAQFRKLDSLQGIMQLRFLEARTAVGAALAASSGIPEPVATAFVNLPHWKSPGRLVRAMHILAQNRFAGDDGLVEACRYWFRGEKVKPSTVWNGHQHLYSWFINESDQLQRHRREIYRVFAAELVKKYNRVFIEEFDLREVLETPEPEDAEYDDVARYHRSKAATSVLRGAIENACARAGATCERVDAMYTTHRCPDCLAELKFNAATELVVKCSNCGLVKDQDLIAARNILARGLRGPSVEAVAV